MHQTANALVMENSFDKTAVETIDLLEARLRRIEYVVCGQVDESALSSNKTTATQRLAVLERSLHQLASKSRVVQDLLRLRKSSATHAQTISNFLQTPDIRIYFNL
jgi:hypothetical protein